MKFTHIKINGIENPFGFNLDHITLSYTVEEGTPCGDILLRIYADENRETQLYTQVLDYAENCATTVNFSAEKERRYFFTISCQKDESELCYFERGTDFDCHFITSTEDIGHPEFIKNFTAKDIVRARLYVTGLGLYEVYLNGEKVGDEYLAPYCNDYSAYVQYQTYDIINCLKNTNELVIAVGNGWYKGRFGLLHKSHIYGDKFLVAAKIVLWNKQGERITYSTDDTWSARNSFTTDSGIYDGETVDMTLPQIECATTIVKNHLNVVERISLPVVIKQEIKPEIIISPKGETILDFKQNFAGFVSFDVLLERGQKVRLVAGEVLIDGCFYRDNLRTAKAEFVYVSDGIKRAVRPRFTFYGFRYMLVEGLKEVDPNEFTGNVLYSDMDTSVNIETGNKKINRLLANCMWGQKSNFLDVPTDCPQRDERLGWTGDAEIFSRTACYQMDCRAFYHKYLVDMRIDQKYLNGGIAAYTPSFKETNEGCYSVWADAATIIPWNMYLFYGDENILRKSFALMEDYVKTLIAADDAHGGKRLYRFGFHLGDWLSQDGTSPSALRGATSEFFIASAYYYNSVNILAKSSEILKKSNESDYYGKIARQIRRAIFSEYFTASGRLAIDTQTAYTLCTIFDLYVDKSKLIKGFATRLKKDNYRIKGGFVGATQVIQALFKNGLDEEAFRMLYSEEFPSWLYCVNLGATTIWERWNSLNADGSISGTGMNSLNHYSFGAVAEAFYAYIAGLRAIKPGFKEVVINPHINYRMQRLDFSYQSVSGRFDIKFRFTDSHTAEFTVNIPYGVKAVFEFGDVVKNCAYGKNIITCKLISDIWHPFSVESKVCDILADKQASEAVRMITPTLYAYISQNDIGLYGESFRGLCSIDAFKIPDIKLTEIDRKLRAIAL